MIKKGTIWSSLSGLHLPFSSCHTSTTSPSALPQPRARPSTQPHFCVRTYADVRSSPDLTWPEHKPPSRSPTPYEIFHIDRGQAYSKRTFYELVKLYHPDRNGINVPGHERVSGDVKLERYRLVILAHEILSDPIKRREYDRCGAGWVERNERWSRSRHSGGYHSEHTGGPFGFGAGYDASPFRNATWEDWERWYARTQPRPQAYEGNYISPNGFASLIILLAVISGVAQATQAGQYSLNLEDKIRTRNQETHNFLESRVEDSNDLGHDGRIRMFLEKRDPTRYGLKDEEESAYKKTFSDHLLPAPKSRPD